MTPLNFGIEREEATRLMAEDATKQSRLKRDPRICKCGHGAKNHTDETDSIGHDFLRRSNTKACLVGKQMCPCESFQGVLTTSDTRKFMSKTTGPGALHALMKGTILAEEKGVTVEWMPETSCDWCGVSHEVGLIPLALKPDSSESYMATKRNVLLCADCRKKLAEKVLADARAS